MNCPVCQNETFSFRVKVVDYTIQTCERCGLGITTPFPREEVSQRTNVETYDIKQRIDVYLSRASYFRKRYKKDIYDIKKFKNSGRLLDVGCNIGFFLDVARNEGFTVTGIEPNRECASYAQTKYHLDVHAVRIEEAKFDNEMFDVVTLFDVLEHIPDLHRMLREIRRILKAEGILVIQSPNLSSLMASATGAKWAWLSPPDHLYHFTPESLSMLLNSSNFSVEHIKTWEPAKDFSDNLITAFISNPTLRWIALNGNALTRYLTFPISLMQRFWWRQFKGGLITVFSKKNPGDKCP